MDLVYVKCENYRKILENSKCIFCVKPYVHGLEIAVTKNR